MKLNQPKEFTVPALIGAIMELANDTDVRESAESRAAAREAIRVLLQAILTHGREGFMDAAQTAAYGLTAVRNAYDLAGRDDDSPWARAMAGGASWLSSQVLAIARKMAS